LSQKIDSGSQAVRSYFGKWLPTMAFWGITWLKLTVSFLLLAFVFLVERVISHLFQLRIRRVPEEQRGKVWRGTLLDTLSKPLRLFLLAYGVFFALSPLYVHFEDPDGSNVVYSVVSTAVEFASTFAIIWFLYGLASRLQSILTARAEASESSFDMALANLLGRTLRIFVTLLGAFIIVQNLTGLPLAPLLGSLGIGGFAIALAGKESISNFLGTVTIFLDRPFKVGDRIVLDRYDGFVEKVGFRSTRIRTFDGHLVAAPNEKIINSFVENIGLRPYIRWRADIGIRYDTPPDKVDRAVEILKEVLDRHEGMKEEMPARVYFEGLKNGCLCITIFAWYHPPEYWDYMAWVHRMSVSYMRSFAQEGIEIAIPSRQVFLEEQTSTDS
jgi:MscS family membrane protein